MGKVFIVSYGSGTKKSKFIIIFRFVINKLYYYQNDYYKVSIYNISQGLMQILKNKNLNRIYFQKRLIALTNDFMIFDKEVLNCFCDNCVLLLLLIKFIF
jgi:hypothetical protein